MENIQLSLFGKTSQGRSVVTGEKTSEWYLKALSEPQNQTRPRCLELTGGAWPKADIIMGDKWSIAYRTFDAQYWGVPQRRRRVYLVADFTGRRADKVLFERERVQRDFKKIGTEGEETSRNFREGTKGTSYTLKIRGGVERDSNGRKAGKGALIQTEKSATLQTGNDQTLFQSVAIETHQQDNRYVVRGGGQLYRP